jgi:phage protein D
MASAPGFKLTINGTSFTQAGNAGLQELVLEDHVDMVGQLSARFGGSEQDPKWKFKIGDEVEVLFGSYEGNSSAPIFSGEIISIEPGFQHDGQSSVTVRALDKIHRLGRGRKTRHWEEMKDSDVASEVGAESGLSVEVDPTEKVHPYILQRNETNVAFLKRLAARNNFTLRVDDNKLLFKKASFQSQDVDVQSGGNLRSVRMAFNSSDMVQKVVVRGWDPAKKQEIVGMCEASSISPMGSGELGAAAASKFGDSTAYITDVPVASQQQANDIAKSEMERLARQFCRGTGSVAGNDKLRAGAMVNMKGMPDMVGGKFFVIASRHIISLRSGYTTEFTFCSNSFGSKS